MQENLYWYKGKRDKEMLPCFLIFQSIIVIVGSMSFKRAGKIDISVKNLI